MDKLGEIMIDPGSGLAGKTVGELKMEYDVNVFIIMRGELTVLATDNTVLKQGDIIIINSNTLVKKKKHGK
jgi:voltage-gated potassium channel